MGLTDAQKAKLKAKYGASGGSNQALYQTPFGTALESTGGGWYLRGTEDETERWATRSGSTWPLSRLRGRSFWAQFDHRGDLVDMADGFDDLGADELSAWADDVAVEVAREHYDPNVPEAQQRIQEPWRRSLAQIARASFTPK